MNKKLTKWYENLSPEQKSEIDGMAAEVISLGYLIESDSGGCKPDPDDTVYQWAGIERKTPTDQQAVYLARQVKDEFR